MDATATFKIGDSFYEVISTQEMDFEEARIVKRLTGAGLGSYELGLADGDPDCWFAQVFISLRRTNPRITQQQVEDLMVGKKLVEIYKSVTPAEEEDEPDPPAQPPSSDDVSRNGGGSGGEHERESLEETHVTPGSQT